MASIATQAQLEASMVDAADEIKTLQSSGVSIAAKADAVMAASDWPGGGALGDSARGARFALSGFLLSLAAGLYSLVLNAYLVLIDKTSRDWRSDDGWSEIWDYFRDTPRLVTSRAVTYDTSVSKTGTGDPTWRRLTVDEDGYAIESVWADDITVECVKSRGFGVNLGEETIRISMPRALDVFSLDISGESKASVDPGLFSLINSDVSGLQNMSFDSVEAATADPTDLGGWLDTTGVYGSARYAFVEDGYRLSVSESGFGDAFNPGKKISLRMKTNSTIYQVYEALDEDSPYDWGVWAQKTASQTGNLTMAVGSNASATVDISTLSSSAFTYVAPTLDQNLWPRRFDNAARRVSITTDTMGGGSGVDIDSVTFQKMEYFNGTYWIGIPGSTALQRDYVGTFTDSIASDSVIQRQVFLAGGQAKTARGVGRYLPHTVDATQVTASGGRTLTFADSGGSDTITASSGSFVTDGYKAGMMVPVAGTSSNNGTHGPLVTVTATVLTFGSGTTLSNEGPLSSTATLDATPSIVDP